MPAARPPAKPSARSAKPVAGPPAKPSPKPTKMSAKPVARAPAKPAARAPAKLSRATGGFADTEAALRAHALAKPEATEHFPWGERAIKVKGKVFLFMYADATRLSLSTKLPGSSGVALMLPFARPTGYGLGKAGWVSASFEHADKPPVDMLCAWIDESYQAVAPAKLAAAARIAAPPVSPAVSRRTVAKR
jgi:predicted DNA-binding protein (MmcQ/YjbR family)